MDLGIDTSFFNDRLQITLDYYHKKTNDLFANQEILWLAGVPNASIPTNFGTIENSGFELFINSINIDKGDFRWDTGFNISTNRNEVVSIPDEDGELLINRFGGVLNQPSAVIKEGELLGAFYGAVSYLFLPKQEVGTKALVITCPWFISLNRSRADQHIAINSLWKILGRL